MSSLLSFVQEYSRPLAVIAACGAAAVAVNCSLTKSNNSSSLRLPHNPALFPNYFVNRRGQWLYYRRWEWNNRSAVKGVVFLAHGFGEHINRYEHVASALQNAGYNVYGVDYHGHGLSDGEKGDVIDFQHYVDDYIEFVGHIHRLFLSSSSSESSASAAASSSSSLLSFGLPTFLLGHSMGGAVAIQVMAQTYRPSSSSSSSTSSSTSSSSSSTSTVSIAWRGCVLSSPLLTPDPNAASPLMKQLASVIAKLAPHLPVGALNIDTLSSDSVVRDRYVADPLVYHGKIQARWGHQILKVTSALTAALSSVTFPFLVIHGDHDRIVLASGSEQLYHDSPSNDKALKVYEGGMHELFNDGTFFPRAMQDVLAWIRARST